MQLTRWCRKNAGLLDKLRGFDEDSTVSVHRTDSEALLTSVKSNLRRLLNTRRGSANSDIEMGLADFNDAQLASRNMMSNICFEIERVISKYEYRLKDITVLPLMDNVSPLKLHFKIHATLPFSDRKEAVEFDLLIEKGSSYKLR
jgi:type VI secretion system protein